MTVGSSGLTLLGVFSKPRPWSKRTARQASFIAAASIILATASAEPMEAVSGETDVLTIHGEIFLVHPDHERRQLTVSVVNGRNTLHAELRSLVIAARSAPPRADFLRAANLYVKMHMHGCRLFAAEQSIEDQSQIEYRCDDGALRPTF